MTRGFSHPWGEPDDSGEEDEFANTRPGPECSRCGSTDVRWRQQGGRWVLFSSKPGVEHTCDPSTFADDFDEVAP
jgi:hypothetical protein